MLLAKEEQTFQNILDLLVGNMKKLWNGTECGQSKVMKLSGREEQLQITVGNQGLENVDQFR